MKKIDGHGIRLIFVLVLILCACIDSCAQTEQDVYKYIKQTGVKHPDIVFKQAKLETGHFTSYLYKTNHNLFAMRLPKSRPTKAVGENKRYAVYRNWRDAIDDYKIWQEKYYKGGDYYEFLKRIGYATDPNYINILKKMK
jgi:flagellum-specific peptidoglycan hydrolase FlgJ|tara:strand:+ start:91 stop:510 length:420 start_codon:yes stop_codon:yes gene_type:complete